MIPVPAFTDVNVLDPSVRELMLTDLLDAALPPLTSLLSLAGELFTRTNFQSLLLHVDGVRGANAFAVTEHPHPSRIDCRHSLTSLL